MKRPDLSIRNNTHGLSKSQKSEYRSWKDMRGRCNRPANKDYKDYGARGIKVCDRWNDFSLFYMDMGPKPYGHTIDRIDVNGGYEPGNCRWATAGDQANNKRTNRLIEIAGEIKTLQQWCRHYGVDHSKVRYRLKIGLSPEAAFSQQDFRK